MNNQQEKTLLSKTQCRLLKKSAHHLKPIVQIGKKGILEGALGEITQALLAHELIKIQWLSSAKDKMNADIEIIAEATESSHVASIGNIAIFFLQKKEKSQFDLE